MQTAWVSIMWHLLILALLQTITGTPLSDLGGPQLRQGLLCGNYSIDVGQTQFIKSKRFAQDYPKNHACDYTFYCTDYAASLVFNCNKFNLQKSNQCKNDFVRVYDNNAVNSKFCGTDGPSNVTTGSNFLGIKFKTNGDDATDSGFFCSVKCFHVNELTSTTTTSTPTPPTTSTTTLPTTSTTTVPVVTPETYSGCKCGIAQSSLRIVGGSETEVGEYPWQAGITRDRLMTPYCGASLLNNIYVITAATCVQNVPDFNVLLGEHDWTKVSHVLVRRPASVSIHPDFNPTTQENNLAIVKLDYPVNLNSNMSIKPICLPDPSTDFSGMKAVATGWGATSDLGYQSPSLQEAEVTVASDSDCSSPNTDVMMCAGDSDEPKGTCKGDTGGPLAVEVDGQYVLAGVTSKKAACDSLSSTGVYSKVQNSLDWIRSQTSDGKDCEDLRPTTTTASTTSTESSTTSATTAATESTSTTAATESSTTTTTETTTTTTTTTTTAATTAAPTLNPGLKCTCGIPPNPLRTASTDNINNNPWTVALISKSSGKQFCTGTVINTYFILTSKSCATSPSNIQVRANAQDITSTSASRYINRNVVTTTTNKDLTLLKLDNPLSLTAWDGIKPACLPSYNKDFTGDSAVHSGYGNLYPSNNPSSVVKKTDGSWLSCSGLGDHVSCFLPSQAQGFCGADVGGPIVSEGDNGRSYLSGIALKDNGCSTSNGMVFQETAKVSDYYQWIWDNAQDGRFCAL